MLEVIGVFSAIIVRPALSSIMTARIQSVGIFTRFDASSIADFQRSISFRGFIAVSCPNADNAAAALRTAEAGRGAGLDDAAIRCCTGKFDGDSFDDASVVDAIDKPVVSITIKAISFWRDPNCLFVTAVNTRRRD
jgi:hypothetical protein